MAVLGATLAVSGCQSFDLGPQVARAPSGFEGQWSDAANVGVATLVNGQFTNVATDTGNRLAEGNYTVRDQSTIDLRYRSLIRQQDIAATCLLVGRSQMNCTASTGAQFTLYRRSGAV